MRNWKYYLTLMTAGGTCGFLGSFLPEPYGTPTALVCGCVIGLFWHRIYPKHVGPLLGD